MAGKQCGELRVISPGETQPPGLISLMRQNPAATVVVAAGAVGGGYYVSQRVR